MQTYSQSTWSSYATPFNAITTSYQIEIYSAVAPLMVGDVVDFGCGAAKIGPYILEQQNVCSYTGIDASKEMLQCAQTFMELQNSPKPFHFIHNTIIDYHTTQQFDSGITVNSYYTWKNTTNSLERIARKIRPGGRFILVTLNPNLDMNKLLQDVRKELAAHPDFELFCKINRQLVSAEERNFASMSNLIMQCHKSGFELVEAHQRFYDGGVNYLELVKRSS